MSTEYTLTSIRIITDESRFEGLKRHLRHSASRA